MTPIISVEHLSKTYQGGFQALDDVSLDIDKGEIFALLGPNGAGKTTLISTICGLTQPTAGKITIDGHDISDFRAARSAIGLVPQEIALDIFSTPWNTVRFSRGLFGKPKDDAQVEQVLKDLSLWDKKDDRVMALSGGMKRRVVIAKALAHEPRILFLDEPTAGVDVELRKGMWEIVRRLRDTGVTIILTTHYIDEAEEMADRVGVINHGKLILVEEKNELIQKLGRKELVLQLSEAMTEIPKTLADRGLTLGGAGTELNYVYDTQVGRTGITDLLSEVRAAGIAFRDLETRQSSLEEIFVGLVGDAK